MASAAVFTKSCAPIQLLCNPGKTYTNPCSCKSYMECIVPGNNVIIRPCANGLLWDHIGEKCRRQGEVLENDRCEMSTPWERCRDIPYHYSMENLRRLCNGDTDNGSSDTDNGSGDNNGSGEEPGGPGDNSGSGAGSDSESGSNNTGAIVGGIIGGVLVIVIIIGIVLYMKKKKSFKLTTHRSNAYTASPESNGNAVNAEKDEEIYDVIDEKAVTPGRVGYSDESYNPKNLGQHGFDNPGLDLSHDSNLPRASDYSLGGPVGSSPHPKPVRGRQYEHAGANTTSTLEEDLSRSITIDGMELQVQDDQGYEIGYPSGSIPRQKKHAVNQGDSTNISQYFILEKQPSTGDYANN